MWHDFTIWSSHCRRGVKCKDRCHYCHHFSSHISPKIYESNRKQDTTVQFSNDTWYYNITWEWHQLLRAASYMILWWRFEDPIIIVLGTYNSQPGKNTDLWLILVFCYIVHCIVIVVTQFGLKRDSVNVCVLSYKSDDDDDANDSLKIFWFV